MKKMLLVAIMVFLCIYLTGCCSIMCGGEKTVNIKSNPSEAKFIIKNHKGAVVAQGVTPTNITLKRGAGYFKAADYTISMEKPGYKTLNTKIKSDVEWGWYAGNVIFGGLIGILILDPITGGMYNIADVNATMESQATSMLIPEEQILARIPQNQVSSRIVRKL